jgi:hypothetical protein
MDPAFLVPGQLVSAQNATYYPGSPAITRAAGRVAFGTVSATAQDVVGLRNIHYDNDAHILIAHASASYLTATVGDTGTFGVAVTGVGVGTQLESAHYRNRFFLMNGTAPVDPSAIGSNRVAYLTATGAANVPFFRQHGMLPVRADIHGPSVGATSIATAFSQSVTGYYEYWTTEVAKLTADGVEFAMESTFAGTPWTVFVSSTGMAPIIEMPALRNGIATHWRIYRSPKKDAAKDKKFPTGFMISEMGISTATGNTQIDGATTSTTSPQLPTSVNTATTFNADFANASALLVDDTTYSTIAFANTLDAFLSSKSQGVYGFNFGGFRGPIKGIEVVVEAFVSAGSAPATFWVRIGKNRLSNGDFVDVSNLPGGAGGGIGGLARQLFLENNTAIKSAVVTATVAGGAITLGSSTDRWFPADKLGLNDADFGPSFMVVLGAGPGNQNKTLSFDYVKVNVYYGATVDSVIQFPTVVYTFGDISAQVGKNGTPPSASTGDIYEDSLVTNDVGNRSAIKWSAPGDPEAFPDTYYIDFETPQNDVITLVKVVNDRLVVGLSTSIWRVNYLPSERDASFDRGKAKQVISSKFGVVNPMCACIFTPGGGSEQLAFISQKGLHTTDAFSFETRSSQLEWRNIQPLSGTVVPIALIDDPENLRLRFICQNSNNANETYLEWHFSYDRGDIDSDGNFKAIGPTHLRNFDVGSSGRADPKSAWSVPRTNGNTSIYYGYGGSSIAAGAGKVYIESGTTIPAEDTSMRWTTRRMYLAGMGQEWKLTEMYGYCGSYSGAPTASYTLTTTKTNDTGPATKGTKTLTLGGSKLHKVVFNQMQEGLTIGAIVTASAYAQERFILDGEDWGDDDSGR